MTMIAQQVPMLTDLVSHRLSTSARTHANEHFSRTRVGTLQMWIIRLRRMEWNDGPHRRFSICIGSTGMAWVWEEEWEWEEREWGSRNHETASVLK